jgi:hypothetical protein
MQGKLPSFANFLWKKLYTHPLVIGHDIEEVAINNTRFLMGVLVSKKLSVLSGTLTALTENV